MLAKLIPFPLAAIMMGLPVPNLLGVVTEQKVIIKG